MPGTIHLDKLDKLLKDTYSIFMTSPKRLTHLENLQVKTEVIKHRMMALCTTRWLS